MLSVSWLLVLGGFVVVSWVARAAAHRAVSKPPSMPRWRVMSSRKRSFLSPASRCRPHGSGRNQQRGGDYVRCVHRADGHRFFHPEGFLFPAGDSLLGRHHRDCADYRGSDFRIPTGTFFSVAMVALAGGAILYDTSNVLHHYSEDRYVAAALELFASVALMLWYVLRLFLSRR